MIKNTLIAAVAVASLVGFAAPAFADSDSQNGDDVSIHEYSTTNLISRLHEKGINASSVEQWGQLVRVFVKLDNGSETMQLFTPDYLQPVTL